MDIMSIIEDAEKALNLIAQGRTALATIQSAISDGRAALDASTQAQLDEMLANEEAQTKAAIADIRSAIAAYRAG
jgi:uncharacterized membrane protein YgcG